MKPAFLTICLNPVIQKTLQLSSFNSGEVNRTNTYRTDASGKGVNVTRVLAQLGADVNHLTHIGGSDKSKFINLIAQDNMNITTVDSKSEIRMCYTILNRENSTTTEIVEEAKTVDSKCEAKLLRQFRRILAIYDYVIISGTKADGYSSKVIPSIVQEAKAANKKVILDIKGEDLINSLEYKPDIIKPNLEEFISTFGQTDVNDKIRDLAKQGITTIITDGINPIKFWNGKDVTDKNITLEKNPLNTTGCGDSFTAGLVYALSKGSDMTDSITEAQMCGRLNAINLAPGVIK
ncbi:MAG: PfkB family carbohydrate kinase [Spirochaetaceae bacterium]